MTRSLYLVMIINTLITLLTVLSDDLTYTGLLSTNIIIAIFVAFFTVFICLIGIMRSKKE